MARILVVDDDSVTRQIVVEILSSAGHQVSVATDGKEGLAAVLQKNPDVVITDLVMPNMGGLKLIGELQRSHPKIRIIAVSGGDPTMGLNFLSAARTYGVETLGKPIRPRELLERVQAALAQPG